VSILSIRTKKYQGRCTYGMLALPFSVLVDYKYSCGKEKASQATTELTHVSNTEYNF